MKNKLLLSELPEEPNEQARKSERRITIHRRSETFAICV